MSFCITRSTCGSSEYIAPCPRAVCRRCNLPLRTEQLQAKLAQRFPYFGLELHPQKTKIVFCADCRRTEKYQDVQFEVFGHAFRPRFVKSSNEKFFVGFNPPSAKQPRTESAKRCEMAMLSAYEPLIEDIARSINPIVRGWCNYYGTFYRSALQHPIMGPLEEQLARWAMRKYRSLR